VANDVGTADVLYHNRRDGTFAEVSLEAGTHDRRASMGLAVGDVWHRGWQDLFATHWVAEDHALWKNQTSEFGQHVPIAFDDVSPQAGINKTKLAAYVGWGCGLCDFENDGELDLIILNGSTIEDELTLDVLTNPKLMPQPPQLLRNIGAGRFEEVSQHAGGFFRRPRVSRGLALADYDQDGRVDAAVVSHGERATLLRNTSPGVGHWLAVRLQGTRSNRFGVGARVRVTAGGIARTQERVLGSSYLSTDSYLMHFGLGGATEAAVEVTWPSGGSSRLENLSVDRIVTIQES
jgi:hypothetical protein